jgi:DNA-binding transcriptional MerR regulator
MPSKSKKTKPTPGIVTTAQLAAGLQVSGQRVRQLQTDGIIKCIKPNAYNLEECKAAYEAWKDRKKSKQPEDMEETKLRKLQAEASILEHKLSVQKGEYVSYESMLAEGQKLGLVIRGMFQRAESDLTPRLAGRNAAEVSVILREYMTAKLIELSQYESPVEIPAH